MIEIPDPIVVYLLGIVTGYIIIWFVMWLAEWFGDRRWRTKR